MAERGGPLSLFAVAVPGLEPLVAAELGELGMRGRSETGGVAWRGGARELQLACLHLRVASRVLVRVGRFEARAFWELEKAAARLPWEAFLPRERRIALRVTSTRSRLYHERAIAERLVRVLEAGGPVRVGADADDEADDDAPDAALPPQLFVVRVHRDRFTVSADASGALLHRRGYRQAVAKAPLRETLAAALLLASEWRGERPLLDPFCGSGTLAIEAALLARGIAPGLARAERAPRPFAFQAWPEHDAALFRKVVERARRQVRPAAGVPIVGTDRDEGAVAAARANAERAGVSADLELSVRPVSALRAPPGPGALITNPPWGLRVGDAAPLRNLYAALGNVARASLPGWELTLLSADPALERHTGLPFEERLRTVSGGVPVRAVRARIPQRAADA